MDELTRKRRAAAAFIQRGWYLILLGPTRLPLKNCAQCDDNPKNAAYVPHNGVEDCPHALDTCHGSKGGSLDYEHVMRLLDQHQQANFGICLEPSNLLVIDVDTNRKGLPVPQKYAGIPGINDGLDVFGLVLERYTAPWPRTLTVRTRNEGLHFWHTIKPGTIVTQSAGKFGWLIDVRAKGSYVPAPGTRTREGEYKRLGDILDPAPAPEWLLHHLKVTGHFPEPPKTRTPYRHQPRADGNRVGQERLGRLAGQLATAPEHLGHGTLVATTYSAAHLVADGLIEESDAEAEMYQAGRARGRTDSEIRAAWVTALAKAGTGARR